MDSSGQGRKPDRRWRAFLAARCMASMTCSNGSASLGPTFSPNAFPRLTARRSRGMCSAKPAIMNRCIYSGIGLSNATLRFLVRNKMNAQIYIPEELGGCEPHGSPGGCHTFHAYTTKDWPDEWFALNKNGQRVRSTSGSGPSQICLTNPEVRKAVCATSRVHPARSSAGCLAGPLSAHLRHQP